MSKSKISARTGRKNPLCQGHSDQSSNTAIPAFKHPSDAWYKMMKQDFHLSDADFAKKHEEGMLRWY